MPAQKSYDLIIVGSGIGGSILAARIAEKGVNPKNGERLRIAMLEAGPYWKGDPKPGYGIPLRRRMITNFMSDDSSDRMWPWGMVKWRRQHQSIGRERLPASRGLQHWVAEELTSTHKPAETRLWKSEHFNIHRSRMSAASGKFMFRDAARAQAANSRPWLRDGTALLRLLQGGILRTTADECVDNLLPLRRTRG